MLVFPKAEIQSFCCVLRISQIAADDGILRTATVVTQGATTNFNSSGTG